MTQNLKVLAMNATDIDAYVGECLERNPVLELAEPAVDVGKAAQESSAGEVEAQAEWRESGDNRWESMYTQANAVEGPELRDQQWQGEQAVAQPLHEQVDREPMADDMRSMAHALIDMLDDDGYLRIDLDEAAADIGCTAAALEQALHGVIHQLDPPGIGARDLSECLLLQLDDDNACDALARRLLLSFPDALCENDSDLAMLAQCDIPSLSAARARLRRLDPFPGHGLHAQENIYLRPEILFLRTQQGKIRIEIPGYKWQRLRMSEQWQNRAWQGADRAFVEHATREARWLLHALDQRRETLHKVAACLAKRQHEFLEYGPLGLKPLTLQDVAVDVGLHESTISRVTNGKYAETPLGLIAMQNFFSAGLATRGGGAISVYRVQQRIRALIQFEPAGQPISDQAIATRLTAEGIEIARRTVTKYRKGMGIPPTSQRRIQTENAQHTRR